MQTKTINGNYNRLGFLVMFCLQKCGANNAVTAVTLYELQSYCPTQQSYSTLYRTVKSLCCNGYVQIGLKDGKHDTYYLSTTGMKLIKECY